MEPIRNRVYRNWGEPGMPRPSKTSIVQDYATLKALHSTDNKFVDPEFPCEKEAAGFKGIEVPTYVGGKQMVSDKTPWGETWARPTELAKMIYNDPLAKPSFAGQNKFSRFSVQQGNLGDCWYVASLSLLTTNQEAFKECVPEDNADGFDAGIFHFRFHYRGTWVDIVIDDRLPYYINTQGQVQLAFMNVPWSGVGREFVFWPALAEKAYAKLYGNYYSLLGGFGAEALEDFTGGISEVIYFPTEVTPESVEEVKSLLRMGLTKDSFLALSAKSHELGDKATADTGIIFQHAYVVVAVEPDVKDGQGISHFLVRGRNPWGKNGEWKGKWSDTDAVWADCPDKQRLLTTGNLHGDFNDGEFWIEIEDVIRNFAQVTVTHWGSGKWDSNAFKTVTAEGNWPGTLPKDLSGFGVEDFQRGHLVELTRSKSSDFNTGEKCTLIVDVTYTNYVKPGRDLNIPSKGFAIAKVADDANAGDFWEKLDLTQIEKSISAYKRSSTERYTLPAGKYVILPLASEADIEETRRLGQEKFAVNWCESDPARRPFIIRIIAESTGTIMSARKGQHFVDYKPAGPKTVAEVTEENGKTISEAENLFSYVPLTPHELKNILDPFFQKQPYCKGLEVNTYRELIKTVGSASPGKIIRSESIELYVRLQKIVGVFATLDKNKTSVITKDELADGLKDLGFLLDEQALSAVQSFYADENGYYPLNEFIKAVASLTTYFGIMKRVSGISSGDDNLIKLSPRAFINSLVGGYYY